MKGSEVTSSNARQHIKKQRHYFANKGGSSQGYDFSCGHVWMWELDCEESWAPKNWCFWTMVLEKTLENPLDCKEIQPVHSKGDQSWVFFGRTDWCYSWNSNTLATSCRVDSLEKTDPGRDWGQEEKGTTEDEMAGWHRWVIRREFEQAPGVADWHESLAGCGPRGPKESDTTEQLNWIEEKKGPCRE